MASAAAGREEAVEGNEARLQVAGANCRSFSENKSQRASDKMNSSSHEWPTKLATMREFEWAGVISRAKQQPFVAEQGERVTQTHLFACRQPFILFILRKELQLVAHIPIQIQIRIQIRALASTFILKMNETVLQGRVRFSSQLSLYLKLSLHGQTGARKLDPANSELCTTRSVTLV